MPEMATAERVESYSEPEPTPEPYVMPVANFERAHIRELTVRDYVAMYTPAAVLATVTERLAFGDSNVLRNVAVGVGSAALTAVFSSYVDGGGR